MQSIRQYRRLGNRLQGSFSKQKQVDDPEKDAEISLNAPQQEQQQQPRPSSSTSSNNHQGDDMEANSTASSEKPSSDDGKEDPKRDRFVVKFDSDTDRDNPLNWTITQKWMTTGIVGCTGFVVGWASAIDSAVLRQAMAEFGVSSVVEALAGTSMYLIAFGIGSLISGPFSEMFGRNPVYIVTLSLFGIFVMASALSPNIGAQIVFRFLAGFFGCTPLTNFGGSVADMWSPLDRTYVFPVCACLSFWGPFLSPMVGAFIGQSNAVSWRWTEWTTLIMTGLLLSAIVFFVPETYAPTILKWKARHLRRITGDERYKSEQELEDEGLVTRMKRNIYRPFQMLAKEIMVLLFSIYLSAVYIVLFTFLTGYDFIFGEIYGFTQGEEGLTWIGVNVGFMIALAIVPAIYFPYKRKYIQAQKHGKQVEPEQRLWYAMIGAPWFPVSLFWIAWTSRASVSYWSPLIATVAFGFGTQGIFISCYQYLIDTYEGYAASALVGMTFSRYILSGVMVVVSLPMYETLGVDWTLTLLGCIAVVLTPIPYVFYFWGARLRQ